MRVHAWTVDDPADMRLLLAMGVDGIVTDRPDLLKVAMGR
jgi:glycerophosphoryl diester phosphodiesterase